MTVLVRCNDCMWTGKEDELEIDSKTDNEHCPHCKRNDCLMDLGMMINPIARYHNHSGNLKISVDKDNR